MATTAICPASAIFLNVIRGIEMTRTTDEFLVLRVGAEGGDMTVRARWQGESLQFIAQLRDSTPLMLDEEDSGGLAIRHDYTVDTLELALARLDRWPWHQLYPLSVHPTFAHEVLAAVKARFDADGYGHRDRLSGWQSICVGAGNHLQE